MCVDIYFQVPLQPAGQQGGYWCVYWVGAIQGITAMDSGKIASDLGWKAQHSFESALSKTVDWYLANRSWWEHIRSGEYMNYYDKMYGSRLHP